MRRRLLCIRPAISGREACSAGESPNTSAVRHASATLNSSTGRFIRMTDSAGNEPCGSAAGDERQTLPRDRHAQRGAGDRDGHAIR